jgi:hypothetical protein
VLIRQFLFSFYNITGSKVTILQFRESLVKSLLHRVPFENLKYGPRQKSVTHLKRKFADHKFEEKEGSARTRRSSCTGCYEKIRQQQLREASNATAKKNKNLLF